MTAHKHAEMIKAKADNMELVVFCIDRSNVRNEWGLYTGEDGDALPIGAIPMFEDIFDYFLCLPQHKEACLHWLNGGDAQTDRSCGDFVDVYPVTDFSGKWDSTFWYMLSDYKSRIKPRKEKRWIAINVKDGDVCICTENSTPAPGYQIKEIEVEV